MALAHLGGTVPVALEEILMEEMEIVAMDPHGLEKEQPSRQVVQDLLLAIMVPLAVWVKGGMGLRIGMTILLEEEEDIMAVAEVGLVVLEAVPVGLTDRASLIQADFNLATVRW